MYPLLLMKMIEKADPAFLDLFFPGKYRCPLDKRIAQAIDEHWPDYFPTQKKCRGKNWTLTISEGEPLYEANQKTRKKLEDWKKSITGTIAEVRMHQADHSWKRFLKICCGIPRLRTLMEDFKPLSDYLIFEESLWTKTKRTVTTADRFLECQTRALLAPGSPYQHADSKRLKFLDSNRTAVEKIEMIKAMRSLFDHPLMTLAILEKCASQSKHGQLWLPVRNHIAAIIKDPSPLTFRKVWFEHAMQIAGATKMSGKSNPRKWAAMLIQHKASDVASVNQKAIDVHRWLHGIKLPSMENIRNAGRIALSSSKLNSSQISPEADLWLLSWMVTLWMEIHFKEISKECAGDSKRVINYYRRFFKIQQHL